MCAGGHQEGGQDEQEAEECSSGHGQLSRKVHSMYVCNIADKKLSSVDLVIDFTHPMCVENNVVCDPFECWV